MELPSGGITHLEERTQPGAPYIAHCIVARVNCIVYQIYSRGQSTHGAVKIAWERNLIVRVGPCLPSGNLPTRSLPLSLPTRLFCGQLATGSQWQGSGKFSVGKQSMGTCLPVCFPSCSILMLPSILTSLLGSFYWYQKHIASLSLSWS